MRLPAFLALPATGLLVVFFAFGYAALIVLLACCAIAGGCIDAVGACWRIARGRT